MSKTINHIGKQIWFDETGFNRTIRKYNAFATAVEPISQELTRMGLKPLNHASLSALLRKNYPVFTTEFEAVAEASTDNLPFIYRPTSKDAIQNGVKSLIKFLEGFENQLTEGDEFSDCPFLDGRMTVTEEFENEVRERFTMRIKTDEGGKFYDAFLRAQQAVKEMDNLGAKPGYHYDFDVDEGLRILNICE